MANKKKDVEEKKEGYTAKAVMLLVLLVWFALLFYAVRDSLYTEVNGVSVRNTPLPSPTELYSDVVIVTIVRYDRYEDRYGSADRQWIVKYKGGIRILGLTDSSVQLKKGDKIQIRCEFDQPDILLDCEGDYKIIKRK